MQQPIGVVLCGGTSSRMQFDKALLQYHNSPQWNYIYKLLMPFCQKVYLSVNPKQQEKWLLPEHIPFITDKEKYTNNGPISGLLSVIVSIEENPILLVACDYPLLKMEHILNILENRNSKADVVCFMQNGKIEPLISLFEISAFQKLKQFFEAGNNSIAKFIMEVKTTTIEVDTADFLKNANHFEAYEQLKRQIKND